MGLQVCVCGYCWPMGGVVTTRVLTVDSWGPTGVIK